MRTCSRHPNGLEITRATDRERPGGLPARAGLGRPPRLGRVLLHAGRPDPAGALADRRGLAGGVEPVHPRAGPPRLSRLARLGGPGLDPAEPARASALGLVVLVPPARCAPAPGVARLSRGPLDARRRALQ